MTDFVRCVWMWFHLCRSQDDLAFPRPAKGRTGGSVTAHSLTQSQYQILTMHPQVAAPSLINWTPTYPSGTMSDPLTPKCGSPA